MFVVNLEGDHPFQVALDGLFATFFVALLTTAYDVDRNKM